MTSAWLPVLAGGALLGVLASPVGASGKPTNPVYDANCALCHQVGGAGLAGQFPRLAGRTRAMAGTPEGRAYLISVALHGMAGRIVVDGTTLSGVMPAFSTLSDADLVSVLNHTLLLDSGEAAAPGRRPARFSVKEVAAVRSAGVRSASEVLQQRRSLAEKGQIPE